MTRMIAFNGLVPRSRNTDGYVMNAYGSDIRQLTDSPGFDENPAWSPDGGQLVFQAQRHGDGDLDSVFANPMSNHAGVWLNDGNGFFTDTGQQLTQYGHG